MPSAGTVWGHGAEMAGVRPNAKRWHSDGAIQCQRKVRNLSSEIQSDTRTIETWGLGRNENAHICWEICGTNSDDCATFKL